MQPTLSPMANKKKKMCAKDWALKNTGLPEIPGQQDKPHLQDLLVQRYIGTNAPTIGRAQIKKVQTTCKIEGGQTNSTLSAHLFRRKGEWA